MSLEDEYEAMSKTFPNLAQGHV
jgi:hypothetical protein